MKFRWLVTIGDSLRYHSDGGDFVFTGNTYAGNRLLQVGDSEEELGLQAERLQLEFTFGEEPVPSPFFVPSSVALDLVFLNASNTWQRVPRSIVGTLSAPTEQGGVVRAIVERSSGDVDRGDPRLWSAEAQITRFDSDKGMEQLRSLSQGIGPAWP